MPVKHLRTFFTAPQARTIGWVFATIGMLFGTWASFIPYIKSTFELDEAELGLLLLVLPFAAACMNPFCIPLIRYLGTVRATIVSVWVTALALMLTLQMPHIGALVAMLFVFGAAFSSANITMNTCAAQYERHFDQKIISTCHGVWSGGAMVGSTLAGLGLGLGYSPQTYVLFIGSALIAASFYIYQTLKQLPDEQVTATVRTTKAFFRPNQALLVLIAIGLCVNIGEGAMSDWAAVYTREVLHASGAVASWGFATYAFFMMTGRLLGDGLLMRYSGKTLLTGCGVFTMIGYFSCALAPNLLVLFAGFAFVGLGISLGSPILYAASAKVPGLPKGAGLAIYTTYAMAGFLGGPVLIGFVAKAFSLPWSFALVGCTTFLWILFVRRFR